MNLTEHIIDRARSQAKPFILWDQTIKGLGAKVFPGGQKSFVLSYRVNGVKKLATLGRCAELSLAEARAKAGKELVKIRDGEADPLTRRREIREAPTVDDLWQYFVNVYAPERVNLSRLSRKTVKDYRNQMKRVLPLLGRLRVRDVKRTDVERVARTMTATPVQRNRMLALLSRLFTLAEHVGMRQQYTNPCRGIVRAREEARDRTFSDTELIALGKALQELADPYPAATAAIMFLAVSGWRTSEVTGLRWSNLDMEHNVVTLPATKAGRQRRMLSRPAIELLKRVPRIEGCEAVFSTTGQVPVGYKHVRAIFLMACQRAGISAATMHDLRRSVATRAAAVGVGLTTLRDLLGHKTTQMAARYARMADAAVLAAADQTGGVIAATMGIEDQRSRRP